MTKSAVPLAFDARERFLAEIGTRVPADRLAEAHFFAPLRQGTIETGVAVLAAEPDAVETASPEGDAPPARTPAGARHVVYSARYRWTRKGPDRGKWECEVVAEADAPLVTVEAVVAGVRDRTSEPLDVERVDGDAMRAMIAEAERRWPSTP